MLDPLPPPFIGPEVEDEDVAITSTSRDFVAVFPERSEAEYTTAYVPVAFMFTLFERIETATEPSTASIAVAPASTYAEPSVSVSGFEPFNVITGATVSGVVVAGVVTVTTTESDIDPAVAMTVVVPAVTPVKIPVDELMVPIAGLALVQFTEAANGLPD